MEELRFGGECVRDLVVGKSRKKFGIDVLSIGG